jgi:hypothetical protein
MTIAPMAGSRFCGLAREKRDVLAALQDEGVAHLSGPERARALRSRGATGPWRGAYARPCTISRDARRAARQRIKG